MNKTGNYNGYDLMMMPLEKMVLEKYRNNLVIQAYGDVLEIGAGSGVNLPYYDRNRIQSLTITDLDPDEILKKKMRALDFHQLLAADISRLPFPDNTFDSVVMTLVLCSVPDPVRAIQEIKRVLKPNGRFIFIEHVVSCSSGLKKAQQVVTPVWKRISGNCHLDRDSIGTIQEQGFIIDNLKQSMFCLIAGGIGKKS